MNQANRTKRKDNYDDVVVSTKKAAQADKGEIFYNSDDGNALSVKGKDKVVQRLVPETYDLGYKRFIGIISQTGTDAPVITPLINEIGGEITTAYLTTGVYLLTTDGLFVGRVRLIAPQNTLNFTNSVSHLFAMQDQGDGDNITISTAEIAKATGIITPTNGILGLDVHFFEIQLHPEA